MPSSGSLRLRLPLLSSGTGFKPAVDSGNGHDVQAQLAELHGEVRRLDQVDANQSLRLTGVLGHMATVDGSIWSLANSLAAMVFEQKAQRKMIEALCVKAGLLP